MRGWTHFRIRNVAWSLFLVFGLMAGSIPDSSHADQVTDKRHELQQAAARRQLWEQKLQQARQEVSAIKQQVLANQQKIDQSTQALSSVRWSASVDQRALQSDERKRLQTLQQARSDLQSKQKAFDNQQRGLTNQLADNAQALTEANQALSTANSRKNDLDAQSVVLQRSVVTMTRDIADKNAAVQAVLVQVYKMSRTSDLELVLSSSSFNDAIAKVTLLGRVSRRDTDTLDRLAKERQDLMGSQALLTTQRSEVAELQAETEAERTLIQVRTQEVHDQQAALSTQLSTEEMTFTQQESDLTAQIEGIQNQKQAVIAKANAVAAPIQSWTNALLVARQDQTTKLQAAQQDEQNAQIQMDQAQHDIASVSSLIAQMQAEAARQQREAEARAQRSANANANQSQSYLPASGNGALARPVYGPITQGFGPTSWLNEPSVTWGGRFYRHFHTGMDIALPYGTPIHAAASGVVWMAAWYGGYGNCIILAHNQHLTTLYGHITGFAVHRGQQVSKGQVIGYMGSTGNSTGSHVHFEVRVDGQFQNPFSYTG